MVYTRGDPAEKLEAMEAIVPPHLRRGTFQPTDNDARHPESIAVAGPCHAGDHRELMALLKSAS
ncbi:hypothetical protein [Mesorhizobium sp. INR15]|uniref:hypothetical protein n=1 Tax=Mesorhizobium sp. INR15 TaxID=2654248 RepID=UPI0021563138|nr:hypothetical protein [Mesorhizobium sp. INR15]